MKTILIDSDVCLDVYLYRAPFFRASTKILNMLETEMIKGVVSVVAFSNIYYLLRKNEGRKKALFHLKMLNQFTTLGIVNSNVFEQSLQSGWNDFEDALQHFVLLKKNVKR